MTRDELFPQLQDALDPNVMAPLLAASLQMISVGRRAIRCSIGEKRHKPGRSCLITYRLGGPEEPPEVAVARLCAPGQARLEFEKERRKRPELSGRDFSYIPAPAMLLWRFPSDRKLVHLGRLFDEQWLRSHLPATLEADGMTSEIAILAIRHQVMHYLPERSCMVRYAVTARSGDQGNRQSIQVYGKTYADDGGCATFAAMTQLDGQFRHGARPLAYDPGTRTLWQSHVPGIPLTWAHLEGSDGEAIAERMGQCTAALHGCTLATTARFTQEQVDQALHATLDIAGSSQPGLLPAIGRLVGKLLAHRQAAFWQGVPDSVIHHDLKLNNFLAEGTSLGLIDMDCLCLGDPLADLGSLIANVYLHALREGRQAGDAHRTVRVLAGAYRRAASHALPWQRLRWHVAAALLHEVLRRSLRQLDQRRLELVPAFLELSNHYAALLEQPVTSADDFV
jgi:hypothetical protein